MLLDYPILVVNGRSTPYKGTVVTGLPVHPALVWSPLDIIATGTDGTKYQAAHEILTRHPDGSAKWLLTAITGTFQPGETKLFLSPNYNADFTPGRDPFFVPANYQPAVDTVVEVEHVDFATGQANTWSLDLANLNAHNPRVHWGTEVYMMFEWSGSITPTLGWRMFAEARKDEGGIRLEFILENRQKGRADGGKPSIVRRASIRHRQADPSAPDVHVPWGGQNQVSETWLGELGVAHGRQCAPLKMRWEAQAGEVVADWVLPESKIPQGGNYAPLTLPGDPMPSSSQVWPESDLGLFVYEKIGVSFFVGDRFPQEHLDCPPVMVWEDPERYEDFLIGGIAAVETWKDAAGTPLDQTTLQRFERRTASYVDPDACTPGHAGGAGERITYRRFIERGGTYPKADDKNPHYGVTNWGDRQWGSGKAGGGHYDVDHSQAHQFLRSRDFRWWYEHCLASRHLRLVDWSWAQDPEADITFNFKEGLCTYEKGQHHGNYSNPTSTHTWVNGICVGYCLTGHPEFLRAAKQCMHHLVNHEHLDGAPVPASWQRGTAFDPRDWGAGTNAHRYGSSTGGGSGYQGNWGIRRIGRVLEMSSAINNYVGSEVAYDFDAYYMRVLGNVQRVESGVWGGGGYILNRAGRSSRYDSEQGWMHAYVVRGIGYAMIYGGPAVENAYRALYDRMYDWLVNLVVYGYRRPDGKYVYPRLAARFDESGVITTVRPGIRSATVSKWYAWRASVLADAPDQQAHADWVAALNGELARLQGYTSPAGHSAWVLTDPGFQQYLSTANSIAWNVDKNDGNFTFLKSRQWSYTDDSAWAGMNHCAIGADALAQGALELGRQDGEVLAARLSEHVQWHLMDGGGTKAYDRVDQNASPIAYRMSQYPNSETKINGIQLEANYSRRVLGQLAAMGKAFWDESVQDLPDEAQVDPWRRLIPQGITVDVNGRLNVIQDDPDIEGEVIVTTAALDGVAPPVVVGVES